MGLAFLVGEGVWLAKTFPARNFCFSQKSWTLSEIKERLASDSRLRVELKGQAASFAIDRKVSGACASDVMNSICELYPSELNCDYNFK